MSEEPSAHVPLGVGPQRPIQEEKHDRALVSRMLGGDERAFEEFFDRYFQGLYRFALTRVDYDEGVAEEIVQAALARVVRKLWTFRGEAALESLATSSDADPERALLRGETARRVQVVLDFLPPRYGDALEWKYVHGLSVIEIADRLGVGQKAAESLLTRAREAFRDGFAALTTS